MIIHYCLGGCGPGVKGVAGGVCGGRGVSSNEIPEFELPGVIGGTGGSGAVTGICRGAVGVVGDGVAVAVAVGAA